MAILVSPGDVIGGRYRIERELGRGGMGIVFKAVHAKLRQPRAIKMMTSDALADAGAARRFLLEAEAASDLRGEHVARVYDFDQLPSGEPYMVMEYLEGADLAAVLKHAGKLPAAEAVLYVRQVCAALAESHSRPAGRLVHRDIKPSNLFLTRRADGSPCVKVLDFGVARIVEPEPGQPFTPLTTTGARLGTPAYMSPEQVHNEGGIDGRSDLWALGVSLYQLLTGRLPFEGSSLWQLFTAIMHQAPVPPSDLADLPPGLEAVVLRCLEKDRDARPESADRLADALQPFAPASARDVVDRLATLPATDLSPTQPNAESLSVPAVSSTQPVAPVSSTLPAAAAAPSLPAAALAPTMLAVARPLEPVAKLQPRESTDVKASAAGRMGRPAARRWQVAAVLGTAALAAAIVSTRLGVSSRPGTAGQSGSTEGLATASFPPPHASGDALTQPPSTSLPALTPSPAAVPDGGATGDAGSHLTEAPVLDAGQPRKSPAGPRPRVRSDPFTGMGP
ncbi:protein kinase [Sorangium sp. So ce291]|uniref:serine/threonine-protein kinase n=1 Tax=Sorangium sp. So ce291 TaxID=3133294 RepID=UPI003F631E25